MTTWPDGMIEPGSKIGEALGFTAELFDGYLWKHGHDMYISVITSLQPGCGNFRKLLDNIAAVGLRVKVPTPLPHMERILRQRGFIRTIEHDAEMPGVEVWVARRAPAAT